MRLDKRHASSITAVLPVDTIIDFVLERINCDSPEADRCCEAELTQFIRGGCPIRDKPFQDSWGFPQFSLERVGLLQAVDGAWPETLLVFVFVLVDRPHAPTNVGCGGYDFGQGPHLLCHNEGEWVEDVEFALSLDRMLAWQSVKVNVVNSILICRRRVHTIHDDLRIEKSFVLESHDEATDGAS